MSVFNENIRALNLYAESPKLHTIRILYFIHAHVFCSYENSETSAQNGFLSLRGKCIFYQHATFGFGWLLGREGLKEKEPWFAASFPFLLHHFQYKQWLLEGSHTGKRGHVWVHRLFVSPGTPFLLHSKQILESKFPNGKPGPWDFQLARVVHENIVLKRHREPCLRLRRIQILRECSAHAPRPIRLHIQNTTSKKKIIKNFKMLTVEPKPSVGLWAPGPVTLHKSHTHEAVFAFHQTPTSVFWNSQSGRWDSRKPPISFSLFRYSLPGLCEPGLGKSLQTTSSLPLFLMRALPFNIPIATFPTISRLWRNAE